MTETNSVLSTLNRLNVRQKFGIVLMGLLITVLYPVVVLMIGLTIVVVYYVTQRDQKKQDVLETKKFCTNCGDVVIEGNKFCGSCGHSMKGMKELQELYQTI